MSNVAAAADGDFNPWEQVVLATAGVVLCRKSHAAIRLLPHLEEAVYRAVGVIAVSEGLGGELERTFGQRKDIRDARVGFGIRSEASAPDGQVVIVAFGQLAGFNFFGESNGWNVGTLRTAGYYRRIVGVDGLFWRADGVGAGSHRGAIDGAVLRRERVVGTGSSLFRDDSLGKQIGDGLAGLGLVGSVDVIEAAVFTDDHDDVLDGRRGS